ncbi:hypothetical protein [Muribaculum intestinale]|uniref:hypothetical protein n=1 Tax=Muribaculum intestinale TaxID=1796646 RepID=UPI0025B5F1B0|nr:hypothetical protein [Muribaculum intestinale]
MKKTFTLLCVTTLTLGQASAIKPVVMPESSTNSRNAVEVSAQTKAAISATTMTQQITNELRTVAKHNDQNLTLGAPALADEETSNEIVTYAYPNGTFYCKVSFFQPDDKGNLEEYTFVNGSALIPNGKNEWQNLVYDKTTGNVIEGIESTWQYMNSWYGQDKLGYIDESKEHNLTYVATPCARRDFAWEAPSLTVGGQTYQPKANWDKEKKDVESVVVGGDGNLNPGYRKYMETKYNRTEMKPTAYITDVYSEALASMYGYSNAFGAGTDVSFYSGTSINDVRTQYLQKNNKYPENGQFIGFGQSFNTGCAPVVLKKIGIKGCFGLAVGDEVTFNIIDVTNNKLVTSTIYTAEEATSDNYVDTEIITEIFDETTELDYVILEAETTYLFTIEGVEGLKTFVPNLISYNATDYPNIPQAFMANTYVLFTNDEGELIPVQASSWVYSLLSSEPNGYAPSMGWILDVEYPYTVPAYAYTGVTATDIPDFFESDDDEIDVKFFSIEGSSAALPVIVTDMDSTTLANSIEYSSEALKEALYVGVKNNSGDIVNGITFTSAEYGITIIPLADIPAGSWIKVNNITNSLKINLPAYELSGIGDVVADGEAVATEYFDLQGRKLAGEAHGVVIKKMTMADGSVKAVKVVK